jgi:hypothetical protein
MAKCSNQKGKKEGIKGNGNKGKYRRGEINGVKKWGKRDVEGKHGSTKWSQQLALAVG